MPGQVERILRYEEALGEVLAAAEPYRLRAQPEPQRLPLLEAGGRVLAEPIRAERDQPPFPRSTRDGFAVRAADLEGEGPLRIVGLVRAGERWAGRPPKTGEALEIMTGAPLPEGADAVLMVEHASLEGTAPHQVLRPEPGRRLAPGENVVAQGAEARAGATVVPAGRVVGAAETALAASCGYPEVAVYRRPRVAILATGDELVDLQTAPAPWQIRNSNSYALAALVAAEGGLAEVLPPARDLREDLRVRIAEGLAAELLLLSGGVSMGKYDLVEEVLGEFGAEFLFTGTRIQPGRPIVFGRLPRTSGGWTYFFGLPGNPISTEVCYRLFAAVFVRALAGRTDLHARFCEARLAEDVRGGAKVDRFLPVAVEGDWKGVSVRLIPWHGSGDLAANGRATGFVVLPTGVERFAAGETVRVLLR